jgi:hypothetical protein
MGAIMRVQLVRMSAFLGAAVTAVLFGLIKKGNDVVFAVTVSGGGKSADVADDLGKVAVFRDVDDFIKRAAKLGLISSTAQPTFAFANLEPLEPATFTGDAVKRAKSTIEAYRARVVDLTKQIANQTAGLGLMPEATPGEIAFKAEKTLQRDTAKALADWYGAEVLRLSALLPA